MSKAAGWRTMSKVGGASGHIHAQVIPEHGADFSAEIANLGTHSLFIKAASGLEFREAVSVRFRGIAVHGEVAFVCREPAGAVVVFQAGPEAVNVIEDLMDDVEVVIGAQVRPPDWEDLTAVNVDEGDPEDPTNPAGLPLKVPVHVEERILAASGSPEEVEVRRAYARSVPPQSVTEPLLSPLPTVAGGRESTVVPEAGRIRATTVVADLEATDHSGLSTDTLDVTEDGAAEK